VVERLAASYVHGGRADATRNIGEKEDKAMMKWTMAALAISASAGFALADGADAIKQRRALMKENGEATKPIVAMFKGGPFDLATVQKALKTYLNAAEKMPGLFPPDSKVGDTNALPAIWDNKADVDARFERLGKDATAALAEVKDEASFKAVMPDFYKNNCGGCHEKYRAKLN
jgi:cytochrome c556